MAIRPATKRSSTGSKTAPRPRRVAKRRAPRAVSLAPTVSLDVLEGITVRVRARAKVTDADVERRKRDLLAAHAKTEARAEGDAVALGDELLVDCVGYEGGELVSARRQVWLVAAPHPDLPGLFEQLAGQCVGQQVSATVTFANNHASTRLAGKTAVFVVHIHAARRSDAPAAAGLFAQLGLGHTADEVDATIRQELMQNIAHGMVREAEDKVLRKVQDKQPVEVPRAAVQARLHDMWQAHSAEWVCAGAPAEQIDQLRDQFLRDPTMKAEAEFRSFCDIFLDAAADALGIEVKLEGLMGNLRAALEVTDLPPTAQDRALSRLSKQRRTLQVAARRQRALEAVLERVVVQFV